MRKIFLLCVFVIGIMPCMAQEENAYKQVQSITRSYAETINYFFEWLCVDGAVETIDFEDFYVMSAYKDGKIDSIKKGHIARIYNRIYGGNGSLEEYTEGMLQEFYGYTESDANLIWVYNRHKAYAYFGELMDGMDAIETLYIKYIQDPDSFVETWKEMKRDDEQE